MDFLDNSSGTGYPKNNQCRPPPLPKHLRGKSRNVAPERTPCWLVVQPQNLVVHQVLSLVGGFINHQPRSSSQVGCKNERNRKPHDMNTESKIQNHESASGPTLGLLVPSIIHEKLTYSGAALQPPLASQNELWATEKYLY